MNLLFRTTRPEVKMDAGGKSGPAGEGRLGAREPVSKKRAVGSVGAWALVVLMASLWTACTGSESPVQPEPDTETEDAVWKNSDFASKGLFVEGRVKVDGKTMNGEGEGMYTRSFAAQDKELFPRSGETSLEGKLTGGTKVMEQVSLPILHRTLLGSCVEHVNHPGGSSDESEVLAFLFCGDRDYLNAQFDEEIRGEEAICLAEAYICLGNRYMEMANNVGELRFEAVPLEVEGGEAYFDPALGWFASRFLRSGFYRQEPAATEARVVLELPAQKRQNKTLLFQLAQRSYETAGVSLARYMTRKTDYLNRDPRNSIDDNYLFNVTNRQAYEVMNNYTEAFEGNLQNQTMVSDSARTRFAGASDANAAAWGAEINSRRGILQEFVGADPIAVEVADGSKARAASLGCTEELLSEAEKTAAEVLLLHDRSLSQDVDELLASITESMNSEEVEGILDGQDVLEFYGITKQDLAVAAARRFQEHQVFLRMSPPASGDEATESADAPATLDQEPEKVSETVRDKIDTYGSIKDMVDIIESGGRIQSLFAPQMKPVKLPIAEIRAAIAESGLRTRPCVTNPATGTSACILKPTEFMEKMRSSLAGIIKPFDERGYLTPGLKTSVYAGVSLANDMIGDQRVVVRYRGDDRLNVTIEGVEADDSFFLAVEPALSPQRGINDEWQQAAYLVSCMKYGHVEGYPCKPSEHMLQATETINLKDENPESLLNGSAQLSADFSMYKQALETNRKVHVFKKTSNGAELMTTLPTTVAGFKEGVLSRLTDGLFWDKVVDRLTPDICDCTKAEETSLAFDRDFVPPMELIAKQGQSEYEDAWMHYLSAARAAADRADAKGKELIEIGMQMDRSIEDAKREILDICGGELTQSAFDNFDVDSMMSSAEMPHDKKLDACVVGKKETDLTAVYDVVSLGQKMCYYTNAFDVACPRLGKNAPACPLPLPASGTCDNVFGDLSPFKDLLGVPEGGDIADYIKIKPTEEEIDIFKNEQPKARNVSCGTLNVLIEISDQMKNSDDEAFMRKLLLEIAGFKGLAQWYTQQGFLDAVDSIVLDTDIGHHYTLKVGGKEVLSTKPYYNDEFKGYVYPQLLDSLFCSKILGEKGCLNLFGRRSLSKMFNRELVGQTLITIVSNLGVYGGGVKNIFIGDFRPFEKNETVTIPPTAESLVMYGEELEGMMLSKRGWIGGSDDYENTACRGGRCACLKDVPQNHLWRANDPQRILCDAQFWGDYNKKDFNLRDDCELVFPVESMDHGFWDVVERQKGLTDLFLYKSSNLDNHWTFKGEYLIQRTGNKLDKACYDTYKGNIDELSNVDEDLCIALLDEDDRATFKAIQASSPPIKLKGDKDRHRLMATLALSCAANNSENYSCAGMMDGDFVGQMRSMGDAREVVASLNCLAAGIEEQASKIILQNIPKVVVEHFKSGRSENLYPQFKGASLNALIQISNALEGFKDDALGISHTLTAIQAQLEATQQQIAVIDAQAGIAMLERTKTIAIESAEIALASAKAGILGYLGDIGGALEASSEIAVLGTALAFDSLLYEAQDELKDEQILQAITELQAFLANQLPRFSQAATSIRLHHEQIQNGTSAFELALERSERALRNAYFNDTNPGWNTAMRRRYNTTTIEYQKAFEEARNAAFLARRALEFRLGIDMSALDRDYPRVGAPAQWADKIYSLQGVDYSNIRGVDEKDPDGLEVCVFTDMEHYADAFIGDYVKKLEIFAEDYAAEHAFSQSSDAVVLSMKNDLFEIRDYEMGLSDNLLYHSENLDLEQGYTQNIDKDLGPDVFVGWRIRGCPVVAADDPYKAPYEDAEPQEPCIFTAPIDSESDFATVELQLEGLPKDESFDTASRGFVLGGNVSELIGMGADPDYLDRRPSCRRPEGCQNTGYLAQRVGLVGGNYTLSYYELDYGVQDTDDDRKTVHLYNMQVVLLDGDEEFVLEQRSLVANKDRWGRRVVHFTVPDSADSWFDNSDVELRFFPPKDGYGTVGLTGFQLVNDIYSPFENPEDLAYQKTTGTRMTKPIGTNDPDGEELRKKFTCRCIYEGPGGDRVEPCGTDDASGKPARCYYEAKVRLNPAQNVGDAGVAPGSFSNGNFNYRHQRLGLNIVGNRIKNCEDSETPDMCLANGMLKYSLQHGGLVSIRNHYDGVEDFSMTSAWLRDAKALAVETRLSMPMASTDRDAMSTLMHQEFRGRPVQGDYVLRIYDDRDLVWENLTDIQWFIEYDYWTRHTE